MTRHYKAPVRQTKTWGIVHRPTGHVAYLYAPDVPRNQITDSPIVYQGSEYAVMRLVVSAVKK